MPIELQKYDYGFPSGIKYEINEKNKKNKIVCDFKLICGPLIRN